MRRLKGHAGDEEDWSTAIALTRKEPLNRAHTTYLEARLINLAREAKRCDLKNDQSPKLPTVSPPTRADMEALLEEMLLLCSVLGVGILEKPRSPRPAERVLYLKGVEARGHEVGKEFVVLAGSHARLEIGEGSKGRALAKYRSDLQEKEILVPRGEYLELTQDYAFSSPSRAASIMLGREASGLRDWRDEKGRTLKDIREEEAGESQE